MRMRANLKDMGEPRAQQKMSIQSMGLESTCVLNVSAYKLLQLSYLKRALELWLDMLGRTEKNQLT